MIKKDLLLWPEKLQVGLDLAQRFCKEYENKIYKKPRKIAFIGMGGSGIAGRVVKTFLDAVPHVESIIIDSPHIPMSVTRNTLAIAISYSGNTWETLTALQELIAAKVPTIVITHGGRALQTAKEYKLLYLKIPESITPRSALGYFLGILLGLFDSMDILKGISILEGFCQQAQKNLPLFNDPAYFQNFLAMVQNQDFFHIWGVTGDSAASAYRAQTQFNENSKIHAVSSTFPELCHNLIVGFTQLKLPITVVFFYTKFLSSSLDKAVGATEELLREIGVNLYKPPILGDTFENQLFNMVLWADFASCYLGIVRNVELFPVILIDRLKAKHKTKGLSV